MRLNDLINQELGRYRIEALIGRGGMAAVYRAFDTRLHRHVALKVLYPQYLADDEVVERFRREAITAAQLDHPHIAPIYDVGEADGLIYLAMKLLMGPSLADVLNREQRLAPERVVRLTYEIAAALDEAHAHGVVHRDIKPGNVLFDDRGRAMLTDFGIAKSLDAPALTESSVIVGTPDYIAPEQIDPRLAPDGKLDYRADLYSLGALIYRALTGRRPFDGSAQNVLIAHLRDDPPPPSSIAPDLPPSVDQVIAKAMAKQRDERYTTALDLAHALGDCFGECTEIGTVFPPTAVRRDPYTRPTTQVVTESPAAEASAVQAPSQRSRARIMLLSVVLPCVLLLGLGAGGFVLSNRSDRISATDVASASTIIAGVTATITPAPTDTIAPTLTAEPTVTITPTITATLAATTSAAPHVVAQVPTTKPASRGSAAVPQSRPTGSPITQPRQSTTQPTAQPTARPTDPPTAQPTAQPTPEPTSTPAPSCPVALAGGFGQLWRSNANVRKALGCPTAGEQADYSVEQLFQGGQMYYREQTLQYWIFNTGQGTYRLRTDVYPSDADPTEQAPDGLWTPKGGFGKLWLKDDLIRQTLGWGTTPETPFIGVYQPFESGMMLFSAAVNGHGKRIYVLYNNGQYTIFNDTYTGP